MSEQAIQNYVFTDHARFEMKRRGLEEDLVAKVLRNPDQRLWVRPGRVVLQSRVAVEGKTCLVRVFVDIDWQPAEVVTAYRTSRVEKYWRKTP